jgi:UDP-N-acetylglucosamine acyltransferase
VTRAVAIHPTAVVGPDVELGPGTVVGPFAVILGPCRIGARCWIGPHTVIGTTAEHTGAMVVPEVPDDADQLSAAELEALLWFGGHGAGIEIGDGTIIREQSTVHQGTADATRIGSSVFVMNKSYVAHDCDLGDGAKLGPVGSLAGHVFLGEGANVGMNASVHQHRRIGAGAMVGMNATVVRDVRPWQLVMGTPARPSGLNRIGLERAGYSTAQVTALETAYDTDGQVPEAFAPAVRAWEGDARA